MRFKRFPQGRDSDPGIFSGATCFISPRICKAHSAKASSGMITFGLLVIGVLLDSDARLGLNAARSEGCQNHVTESASMQKFVSLK